MIHRGDPGPLVLVFPRKVGQSWLWVRQKKLGMGNKGYCQDGRSLLCDITGKASKSESTGPFDFLLPSGLPLAPPIDETKRNSADKRKRWFTSYQPQPHERGKRKVGWEPPENSLISHLRVQSINPIKWGSWLTERALQAERNPGC